MIHSIQAARAIAALLVVFFHAAGTLAKDKYFGQAAAPLERAFWFGGDAGVAFFFVLSGFIIHYVHFRDFDCPKTLVYFLRRRIVRIYPTYWIIFSVVFIGAISVPTLKDTVPSDIIIVLKSLLLVPQDINIVGGTGAPVLAAAWSLQYEIVFYAAFALALINRWLFYAMIAAYILNFLSQPVSGLYSFPRSFLSSHLILLFVMGMWAARVRAQKMSLHIGRSIVIVSSTLFVATAVLATWYREESAKPTVDLLYGVASAALIIGLTNLDSNFRSTAFERVVSRLGESSFALYLIHFPLVSLLSKAAVIALPNDALGVVLAFALLVFGSVFIALLFNSLIERPLLRHLSS
jgi:peptidoglycan/LPS O-acetylase OafA/YrhL